MKNLLTTIALLGVMLLPACCQYKDKEEEIVPTTPTVVTNTNFKKTIHENPLSDQILGTVISKSLGTLVYSIKSQALAGAIAIDATTGELTVADATLYDFETNPTLTAMVEVTNGSATETLNVTITLTNLNEIGDFKEGGIIFWIDPTDNAKGLVVGLNDLGDAKWGCYGTSILGAQGATVGTGAQNTLAIEAGCTPSGTASDLCANSTIGGYSDWFLPSIDALSLLYLNRAVITPALSANSGAFLFSTRYWSSTERSSNNAWLYSFFSGTSSNFNKFNTFRVRAVRAF